MTSVRDARARIHASLGDAVAEYPTTAYVPVHTYPPATIASPCIWVDMPLILTGRVGNVGTTLAQFPVVATFDGSDAAQTAAMDDLVGIVWDAIHDLDGVRVETVDPSPLDIGGPTTRSLVFTVTIDLGIGTLCRSAGTLAELAHAGKV